MKSKEEFYRISIESIQSFDWFEWSNYRILSFRRVVCFWEWDPFW